MITKIDPYLYGIVKTESNITQMHDCLIFTNAFKLTKNFLTKKFKDVQEYPFINAFGVKSDGQKLFMLANFQHIQYITASTKVFKQVNIAKKVSNINSLHKQGYFGKGVNIAFIDTGISPHLDFVLGNNKIIYFKDFVNEQNYPYDDEGHGTFVAGVATGTGIVSKNKYMGIAPMSKIISLKALNEQGETDAFTILKAMQWIFDNHIKFNIKVVCMSFGSLPLGKKDPLCIGAETLWNKGIIVVAAAGNSGPETETIKSPGTSQKIITVGAVDDKRQMAECEIANFSSRGPAFSFYKPDCVASGVNLNGLNGIGRDFYIQLSGTSVATPIVAGLCALLLEKYPNYSPNHIKSLILKNCVSLCGNRNLEGFGLINAEKL